MTEYIELLILMFILMVASVRSSSSSEKLSPNYHIPGFQLLDHIKPHLDSHKTVTPRGVKVYYGLSLLHIINLDEDAQVLKVHMRVGMSWQDPFFTWNPKDYGGIEHVFMPSTKVWQPDIILVNCIMESFKSQMEEVLMDISHTGRFFYTYPIVTEAQCMVDVRYFPFDIQVCTLMINSWSYTKPYINILEAESATETAEYLENSAWLLLDFSVNRTEEIYSCCEHEFTILYFKLTLARRWEKYIAYLILPNILMNIMCIVQFLLPCDSNERVGYGITLYVSLLVYLILVENILPATVNIPLISFYLTFVVVEAFIAEVTTIVVLFLHNQGLHDNNRQMPAWMKKIVLKGIAKVVGMHHFIMTDEEKEALLIKYGRYVSKNVDEALTKTKQEQVKKKSVAVQTEMIDPASSHDNANRTFHNSTRPERSEVALNDDASNRRKRVKQPKNKELIKKTETSPPTSAAPDRVKIVENTPFSINSLTGQALGGIERHTTYIQLRELEQHREFLLQRILGHINNYEERLMEEQQMALTQQEWQQAALIIDRLMFYLYAIFNVILWIVLLYLVMSYQLSK